MKAFIFCLAVAAVAAESNFLYPNFYHSMGYPFYSAAHHPYMMPVEYKNVEHRVPSADKRTMHVFNQNPFYMTHQAKVYSDHREDEREYAGKDEYHAENAGAVHMAKREAEPFWPFYSNAYHHNYFYNHMTPYFHYPMVKQVANDRMRPENYASKGEYVAESAGTVHIAKREAEPFWPFYSNAYHHNYFYNHMTPYFHYPQMKQVANDRFRPENYASKGQYVAESAGTVHIAKREAEPFYPFYNNAFNYRTYSPFVGMYNHYNTFPYVY